MSARHAPTEIGIEGPGIEQPSEAACGRAGEEDRCTDEEHAFAAVEIGKSTVNRSRDRLRQQIRGKHPAKEVEAAQIADDRRHGGSHDRGFHGGHENGHHAGCGYRAPACSKFDRLGRGNCRQDRFHGRLNAAIRPRNARLSATFGKPTMKAGVIDQSIAVIGTLAHGCS